MVVSPSGGPPFFLSPACPDSIKDPISLSYHGYRYSIATLAEHFGYIMKNTTSVTIGNNNNNCNNETYYRNNTFNLNNIIADENPEIMKWLSPLDPRGRHHDVRTDRVDGVGSWLLETNEFREWRGNEGGAEKAVLFCYGDPGVGKTYLR